MATDQQPQPPRAQLPVEERKWNHIVWSVSDTGVLALTMNRPERLHALDFPMLHELLELNSARTVARRCASSPASRAPRRSLATPVIRQDSGAHRRP